MGQEIINYNEQMAKAALAAAAAVPVKAGTFLSTKGGVLTFGEEELPGNQACVIVLSATRENTYYQGKYDADNPSPPVCYAFGGYGDSGFGDTELMEPHISMQNSPYFQVQSPECKGCPMNEWGSADQGRGKACQNKLRLALIPAGVFTPKRGSRDFDLELFNDPKDFAKIDIAQIRLPVTSGETWAKYVSQLSTAQRRPPYGVFTRLFVENHPKYQHVVHFEMLEEVPNELIPTIIARHEEACKLPFQGYMPPEEQPAQRAGSLKGLRRGR